MTTGSKIHAIKSKRAEVNSVTPYIEDMLEMAKRGEIVSFAAIVEADDGGYHYIRSADETPYETAGKMLAMAMERVK